MAATNTHSCTSPFKTVPDDVQQRVLLAVPLEDHRAAASVCRAFRAVIEGPRFPALRRVHGFAERGIVIAGSDYFRPEDDNAERILRICMGHKSGVLTSIPGNLSMTGSTTDGCTRLFACNRLSGAPNQILAVDVSSRRWRRIATLPDRDQHLHCMEWHGGLLYVAGGSGSECTPATGYLNSLHVFNEATGLWEDRPPMPRGCILATSGVIGNQLFVVGGSNYGEEPGSVTRLTTQIYDIAARAWRLGAPPPKSSCGIAGLVLDAKLFMLHHENPVVYDPQFDTWTDLPGSEVPWSSGRNVRHACVHDGRIVVFLSNHTAFQRASDEPWSPCAYEDRIERMEEIYMPSFVSESVFLG